MLDMSCVVNDPLLSTTFNVRRNNEVVNSRGRTTKASELFENVTGIVHPVEPASVQRSDVGQMGPSSISVVTSFALRKAAFGFQPDVVLWNGAEYTVVEALPYQQMAGFTRATATSTRAMDSPEKGVADGD